MHQIAQAAGISPALIYKEGMLVNHCTHQLKID
jgi:hypothetical protein